MSTRAGRPHARIAVLVTATVVLAALAIAYYMLAVRRPAETSSPTAPAKPGVFKEATDGSFQPFGPPSEGPPKDYHGPLTTVSFASPTHDFGQVMQNSVNDCTFEFTNTGQHPLVVTSAIGSCGCTAPEYPKKPIPPGGTGEIHVVYRPSATQEGYQSKTISVKTNTDPSPVVLRITADVQKP